MQKISLDINNKTENFFAEIVDQKLWVKQGDQTWSYDLIDLTSDGQRRKKSNTSSPDQIISPMPGKVTKVFVKSGDAVQKGQPLLVMEAMKMEYTLKSDLITTVEKVNVSVNEQVVLGHLLIKLKPEGT